MILSTRIVAVSSPSCTSRGYTYHHLGTGTAHTMMLCPTSTVLVPYLSSSFLKILVTTSNILVYTSMSTSIVLMHMDTELRVLYCCNGDFPPVRFGFAECRTSSIRIVGYGTQIAPVQAARNGGTRRNPPARRRLTVRYSTSTSTDR